MQLKPKYQADADTGFVQE